MTVATMTQDSNQTGGLIGVLDKLCLNPLGMIGLLILLILPYIPPFNQEYLIRWLAIAGFIAASAIAFDLTAGYINIVNFGFNAFVGLGGYTSAILASRIGLTPWVGMFAGALVSALIGFLLGVLTLRLRGIFGALMTWFLGLAMMGIAIKWVALTRGPLGLRVDRLFDTTSNIPYYYLILIIMFVIYLVCSWLVRSKMGLAFKAIGQNMEAARTSGINPTFYRIVNFTISCALAGWLGGFYAHYIGILTPDLMHTSKTVEVLAVAYIGGRGSLWGPGAIAIPFTMAMELIRSTFSNLAGLHLIIYGIILIIVMIFYSGGVAAAYDNYLAKSDNPLWRFLTGRRSQQAGT
jgi:branched-chain amino acid transport system permease protein